MLATSTCDELLGLLLRHRPRLDISHLNIREITKNKIKATLIINLIFT